MKKTKLLLGVVLALAALYGTKVLSEYHYAFADPNQLIGQHIQIEEIKAATVTDTWSQKDGVLILYKTPSDSASQYGYAVFKKSPFLNKYKLLFHDENNGEETNDVITAGGVQYIFKITGGKASLVGSTQKKSNMISIVISMLLVAIIVFFFAKSTFKRLGDAKQTDRLD